MIFPLCSLIRSRARRARTRHPGGVTPLFARRAKRARRTQFCHPKGDTLSAHFMRGGLFSRTKCARDVSAPFSLRGKEKAAGGKKKTPKGDFGFPLWNPLKTTKKGLLPLLGFSQEFGLCKANFKPSKNAITMRIWTNRRGS